MKVFTQHGIFSEATWKVFDAIIGDDYTKEEMEEILSSIERNLEGMGFLIRDNDNGDVQLTKKVRDNIESILADRDVIIRRIKDRI
jgi:hypothetical protein